MSYGKDSELKALETYDGSGIIGKEAVDRIRESFFTEPSTVLDEAKALVYGDREAAYGHPYHDFKRIADVWTGYLAGRSELTPADVPQMMLLLKACRAAVDIERGKPPKHDTIVDEAGYAECAHRVAEYDGQKGIASR